MNVKNIYLVRHGQSQDALLNKYQRIESPLSTYGQQQAAQCAKLFDNVEIDGIISSTLARARDTARSIGGQLHKTVEESDLFVESVSPAGIDGEPYTDVRANELQHQWLNTIFTSRGGRMEGGENFSDMLARSAAALNYLEQRSESNLIVATHGFFMRFMLARCLFDDKVTPEMIKNLYYNLQIDNASMTTISLSKHLQGNRWSVRSVNAT